MLGFFLVAGHISDSYVSSLLKVNIGIDLMQWNCQTLSLWHAANTKRHLSLLVCVDSQPDEN